MELKSRLYRCMITHKREKPKPNAFAYRIFMFLIDVDEVDRLVRKFPVIGHNKFNLFGFYDRDHFKKEDKKNQQSIREKLAAYLKTQNIGFQPHRIELLTNLRVLGYVFNPVSFYYLYDENEEVKFALAEVSNTFGEMKYYLLQNFERGFFHEFHDKYFYISPFTKPDDRLELKVGLPKENFSIMVDDIKGEEKSVRAAISAEQRKFSNANLLWYFFRFPLITFQIIGLIHWQALKLWLKGVKFYGKDENKDMQREMYFAKSD